MQYKNNSKTVFNTDSDNSNHRIRSNCLSSKLPYGDKRAVVAQSGENQDKLELTALKSTADETEL